MQTQPIENYGVIGNMRSAALVSITGSIDFFCFPSFDSPTVFASLLDESKGGSFRIDPGLTTLRTKQLYLPDTNILVTRFLSSEGLAELTDLMPVAAGDQASSYAHQVIRMLRVVRGEIPFRLLCAPRFDYARAAHTVCQEGDSLCFRPASGNCPAMSLHASVPLRIDGVDGRAEFTLASGQSAVFAFGRIPDGEKAPIDLLDRESIERQFDETAKFWRTWISKSRYTGRWREMVDRSALVLKLLTSHEHGSLVAAPTFGLPEQPGGSRNWDYRYTWLRDSAFSMYAFMRLGLTEEATKFTAWLRARVIDGLKQDSSDGPLHIMYRVDGRRDLDESTLDHLEGYRGARPVRIGNGAGTQLQLDVYGEIMDAVYLSNKYTTGISNDGWARVRQIIDWLGKNWERPDEGIWEVRSGRQHFLHSRLMCWVAMDRAIRLAQKRSLVAPFAEWFQIRDAIHEDIFQNFWSDNLQSFVEAKGSQALDGATLLMPLVRFISPTDPRWVATMKAIEEHLCEDALVYRYSSNNDGLDGQDGGFLACSFWRIECLARMGETDKARLLFDKLLGYANHLGLYAEELDPSGEQTGNFPQALTHLALISAASYLDRKLSSNRDETWQ
jgi:GH15 family glucan-1,4-alpha-glucosidase